MSMVIDDDAPNRPSEGLIGVAGARRTADEGGVPQLAIEDLVELQTGLEERIKATAWENAALKTRRPSDLFQDC